VSEAELERIAGAAEHLKINHNTGAYHKPVALVWALDRAMRGLPRLVAASVVRVELDPLLEELSGAESNAAWPWLKLATDLGPVWVVDGADPAGEPPAEFVAGWSRSAYLSISENPDVAHRVIDGLFDRYLNHASDTVARYLRLEDNALSEAVAQRGRDA